MEATSSAPSLPSRVVPRTPATGPWTFPSALDLHLSAASSAKASEFRCWHASTANPWFHDGGLRHCHSQQDLEFARRQESATAAHKDSNADHANPPPMDSVPFPKELGDFLVRNAAGPTRPRGRPAVENEFGTHTRGAQSEKEHAGMRSGGNWVVAKGEGRVLLR